MEELKLYDDTAIAVIHSLESFDINDVPKSVRDRLYKSYADDFLFSKEYYEPGMTVQDILNESVPVRRNDVVDTKHVTPVKELIESLVGILSDADVDQFRTITINGIESMHIQDAPEFWIQPVYGFIPNQKLNIDIIDHEMKEGGYVRVRTTEHVENDTGRKWYFVVYNPDTKYLKSVRELLRTARLFHYTPEFNRDDILETGLVPSKGGRTFMYPDERVFFYVNAFPGLSDSYIKMMSSTSKKIKKKDSSFSGYFDLFELNIDKLPESIKIYYDPNAKDCVFVTHHIEPEWIDLRENLSREF